MQENGQKNPSANLAKIGLNVAIANGYYDYNHFLKEFKDFTGKTPVEYISRKEVPFTENFNQKSIFTTL